MPCTTQKTCSNAVTNLLLLWNTLHSWSVTKGSWCEKWDPSKNSFVTPLGWSEIDCHSLQTCHKSFATLMERHKSCVTRMGCSCDVTGSCDGIGMQQACRHELWSSKTERPAKTSRGCSVLIEKQWIQSHITRDQSKIFSIFCDLIQRSRGYDVFSRRFHNHGYKLKSFGQTFFFMSILLQINFDDIFHFSLWRGYQNKGCSI